jgi:DNA-binding CsgD family transcriptional regulator
MTELTPHLLRVRRQSLTARELDVLRSLATGATYEETAQRLGISYATVSQHAKDAYRLLGANSAVQAFIKMGWLTPT